jgi:hypothetical protein
MLVVVTYTSLENETCQEEVRKTETSIFLFSLLSVSNATGCLGATNALPFIHIP